LVENVRALVNILPGLNITQDSRLLAIADRMQQELCRFNADDLRDKQHLRSQVAMEAESILSDVSSFMA
jgi:hypothetical protein